MRYSELGLKLSDDLLPPAHAFLQISPYRAVQAFAALSSIRKNDGYWDKQDIEHTPFRDPVRDATARGLGNGYGHYFTFSISRSEMQL